MVVRRAAKSLQQLLATSMTYKTDVNNGDLCDFLYRHCTQQDAPNVQEVDEDQVFDENVDEQRDEGNAEGDT